MREGSRLVEDGGPCRRELLEHSPALDDHAVAGGAAHAADERDRRCDKQRARGREHEHLGEPHRVARHPPRHAGEREREQRERHGVAVGEPHDRRLRVGRLGDECHDLLVLAVGSGRRRDDLDGRLPVHGAAHHHIAGTLLDGHALTGDRRFVEGRLGRAQGAIDREDLARPHEQHVARLHLVGRDLDDLVAAPSDGRAAAPE